MYFYLLRLLDNLSEMGIHLPVVMKVYWLSMWTVITPAVLIFILVMTFVQYAPVSSINLGGRYVFPTGIQVRVIFLKVFGSFLILPIY